MPKVHLSIVKHYLPTWGAFEGVRETIQNAKDGQTQYGGTVEAWHLPGGDGQADRLIVENTGAVLERKHLLLGQTSKTSGAGAAALIGQFGEGLKLGLLALVRAGHAVKIRTGGEVWTPEFAYSETYGAEVLTFDIATGREDKRRVRVEIEGITADQWAQFKQCFLFLQERKADDTVETPAGTMLLAPRMKGRLFVKGIFVQTDAQLAYGYDLKDIQVDRDRKMLASYDLQPVLRQIWNLALGQRQDLSDSFVQILDRGKPDVQGFSKWNVSDLPQAAVAAVAKAFTDKHGNTALPVQSLSESKDLGHYGVKGVVVSDQLSAVLQRVLGSTDKKKASLKTAQTTRHSWHTLSAKEQDALVRALDALGAVAPGDATLDNVDVVDFGDAALRGLWDPETKRIAIARKRLAEGVAATLGTLLHEVAHQRTGAADGDKAHVAEIERLWTAVYTAVRA